MLSRDGIGWERPFRAPFFLARSSVPSFDSGSIFTNSTPVILDDEIRFYYGAYSQGATGADDRTVQLNITWIYGSTEQLALRYAWRDYPNMPLTSGSPYDLPAPPFHHLPQAKLLNLLQQTQPVLFRKKSPNQASSFLS